MNAQNIERCDLVRPLTKPLRALIAGIGCLLVWTSPVLAETYSYDDAGRLTGVVYDDGSSISYTYDNNGNILNVENVAVIVNTAPVCNDVNIVTDADTLGSVAPDCVDADADPLTYSVVAQPSDGSASVVAGDLVYTPNNGFAGSDSFTYQANDGTDNSNSATVGVTVNPIVPALPEINVSPGSHDFGSITVGTTSNQLLTIGNTGTADLSVTSIALSGGDAGEFLVATGSCASLTPTLVPAASCTIDASFGPTSAGSKSTAVRILSNDPTAGVLDVPLDGIAVDELIADAGADQSVDEFDVVMLDGSGSSTTSGTITGYDWQQLSGPNVVLSDPAAQSPTFTAPDVGVAAAVAVFELTVMNDLAMNSTATVSITINDSITPAPATIANSDTQPAQTNVGGGAQDVVLMRFIIDLPYDSDLSSLGLSSTGNGDFAADVTNVQVFEDINDDGVVDAGDALVGEGQYGAGGTLTLSLAQSYSVAAGRRVFLVVYDFAP